MNILFLDCWILEDEGTTFLGSFGTSYPSTHHHIPENLISVVKDSFVATATLSSLECELVVFLYICSDVRSVLPSVIASYLHVIQKSYYFINHKIFLNLKRELPPPPFSLSLFLSVSLSQGIHKRLVRFQKLTRNLFLTLHGHNVHRQQRQLSQVSHAVPAVCFSCLLRSQFPRRRRSRNTLSVCSVLRCPDL